MNTAVDVMVLPRFNSFGAEIGNRVIPQELCKRLDLAHQLCKQCNVTTYINDNKTGFQFVVNKDGISLMIERVELYGPSLPVIKQVKEFKAFASPIYTNSRYKGD